MSYFAYKRVERTPSAAEEHAKREREYMERAAVERMKIEAERRVRVDQRKKKKIGKENSPFTP